jgi:hypothetical protein
MLNSRMSRTLRSSTLAFLTLVLLSHATCAPAQTNAAPAPLVLTAAVTNHDLVLSWHIRAGNWGIVEQQPAFKTDWKRINPELYRTNGDKVSVKLALPAQTALYRLQHVLALRPAGTPAMPPLPPAVTNRTKPASFPAPAGTAAPQPQDAGNKP